MGYTGNEYIGYDRDAEEPRYITIRECVAGAFPHRCVFCGRKLPGKYYEVEVEQDVFLSVGVECIGRWEIV